MYFWVMADYAADRGVIEEPLPRPGRWTLGRPISQALPEPIVFAVDNTDDHPPGAMEGLSVPAWSGAFVRCLQSAGVDNLQLFPAVLRNAEGRTWTDYFAVNVVGAVSCLAASSKTTPVATRADGAPFVMVHDLVIDGAKTEDRALFRLAESPGKLLAHERIRAALERDAPPGGWGIVARPVSEAPR